MAALRSSPIVNADGSLKPCPPGVPVAVLAGAGEGVAGGFVAVVPVEATGAGGGAGVEDVCAGVDGAGWLGGAAGAGFG
jgi:hypothetical protein